LRGSEVRQLSGMTNVIRVEQSNREGGDRVVLSWINSWAVGHSETTQKCDCPQYGSGATILLQKHNPVPNFPKKETRGEVHFSL